jgi:hypothetical protein
MPVTAITCLQAKSDSRGRAGAARATFPGLSVTVRGFTSVVIKYPYRQQFSKPGVVPGVPEQRPRETMRCDWKTIRDDRSHRSHDRVARSQFTGRVFARRAHNPVTPEQTGRREPLPMQASKSTLWSEYCRHFAQLIRHSTDLLLRDLT